MAIHFENYKTYSKGQGFIGAACKPVSPQAKTLRWKATDCPACKETLIGKTIVSRHGDIGEITECSAHGVIIKRPGQSDLLISYGTLDDDWVPLPLAELFGEGGA